MALSQPSSNPDPLTKNLLESLNRYPYRKSIIFPIVTIYRLSTAIIYSTAYRLPIWIAYKISYKHSLYFGIPGV